MDVSGQGVLKPELDKAGDDWDVLIDKSKTKLPKGAKENYVRQLVDKLFFNWLEDAVDGKRGKVELKQDRDDLTYTAKINFK